MAVDTSYYQYLLILAPSLVIALSFLFFWLTMKETSYDEVLARQKRDLKLPPSRPDTRKKNGKKKSKKKESAPGEGSSGGGGGESEEDLRDFDMADGVNGSVPEVEDEPAPVVTPDPAPTAAPVAYVPPPVTAETPAGRRGRKKKAKKAARAAAAAAAAASAAAAAAAAATAPASLSGEPELNGSKSVSHIKAEPPAAAGKQSSPPSPHPEVQTQVQVKAAQAPPQTSGKKEKKKQQQKVESVDDPQPEVKVEQAPASLKDTPILTEFKVLDAAAPSVTVGKKKNANKKQNTEHVEEPHAVADSAASANHQAAQNDDAPSKGSGKKQKHEPEKERRFTEAMRKELLSELSSMALSEADAVSVMALIREKSPNAVDAWQKSSARPDPALQERERMLTTLQEESSIAKDKVKQLSQELQVEKQKTGRVEAMMREQRAAMEKELGSIQGKAQSTYQELQAMQIKYQQVREQFETQINRLQQENGILRDAVSSATNQMESKNSAELNKLRAEYAGLMKELADNNSKLQQEEHQRKSLEVGYKQNASQLEAQLQDAKRRWEELQNFFHNVNSEREKLQSSNQELHNQMLAVETEMNNKNKEFQTLHSSLTEARVSKERLEQRVMELMELSQRSMPDDSLQNRVQELLNENKGLQVQNETLQVQNGSMQAQISSQVTHVSHIEELQKLLSEKKSLEDSLNAERSSGASRDTNLQALHNENMSLKAEIRNLQAQISDQTASQLALDHFQKSVWEKEENMKTVEGLLEKGLIEVANKEEELTAVRVENEGLRHEIEGLQRKTAQQASSESMVGELQSKVQEQDVKLKSMEDGLQAAHVSLAVRDQTVEFLEQQLAVLQADIEQLRQREMTVEPCIPGPQLLELQAQLAAKDQQVQTLQAEMETRSKEMLERMEQELQQKSDAEVPNTELLTALSEREKLVSELQAKVAELNGSLEFQRKKNNENQASLKMSQAECQEVLHRLLPHVPLPNAKDHQGWLKLFERAVAENAAAASEDSEALAEKLTEAEETQRILQKDCETYKKVLAETEGILQRLQTSVEQEESRWKVKLEAAQGEQKELKSQLTQTLSKLEAEENERQKVAGDLYKAQQSVDLIQGELSNVTDNAGDLIENSGLAPPRGDEADRREKTAAGLTQTVRDLQQLLQGVSRQLAQRQSGDSDEELSSV